MIKVSAFADKSVVDLPPNFETEWKEITEVFKKNCSVEQLSQIRLVPKRDKQKRIAGTKQRQQRKDTTIALKGSKSYKNCLDKATG